MSYAAIKSQYSGLNGLSGYGYGYASGLYSETYVDNAKESIQNGYEVSATSSSYSNKSEISASSFKQQCQAIQYLIKNGRTDDAMAKYQDLYEDMASNSYYSACTENEIKTLLQQQYMNATDSTLVSDINSNSDGAYMTGFTSSIPIFGALTSTNSKDEFTAEVSGTSVSGVSKLKTAAGVATGAAASGALAAAAVAVKNTIKGSGNSKTKWIAAGVAAAASLVTYGIGKIVGNNKSASNA